MYLEYWDKTDVIVFYVFAGVSALITVLGLGLLLLGCCTKKKFIPGAAVDFLIVIGALLVVASVLMHGLNTEFAERDIFEGMCQVYVAPLLFGLGYVFGGYLIKACAIFHYFKPANRDTDKHPRSVEWKPIGWLFVLILIDAAAVLVWCIVYTMELKPGTFECVGEHEFEWKLALAVYHGVLLLLAAIMVWPALNAAKRRVANAEAQFLVVMTYNAFFAVVAGCLLYFFLEASDTVKFAITGGLLLYVMLFTIIILLASHLNAARQNADRKDDELSLHHMSESGSKRESGMYENDGYANPMSNNDEDDAKPFDY